MTKKVFLGKKKNEGIFWRIGVYTVTKAGKRAMDGSIYQKGGGGGKMSTCTLQDVHFRTRMLAFYCADLGLPHPTLSVSLSNPDSNMDD